MFFPNDRELTREKVGATLHRSAVEHDLYDDREACVSYVITKLLFVDWCIG